MHIAGVFYLQPTTNLNIVRHDVDIGMILFF